MRTIMAAVVGTLAVFLWGLVSWGGLELWSKDLQSLPNADRLLPEIRAAVPATGAYAFPPRPDPPADADASTVAAAEEAWVKRAEAGPVGILLVRPAGATPMSASMFVTGIVLEFAGALLLAVILSVSTRAGVGLGGRLLLGFGIVVFGIVAGVLVPSNFMLLPAGWTRAMAGDFAIGWGLAVIAISLVVRTPRRGGRHARA
ncbi:MAG: hypothetical protein VX672_10760 [Planctomycetota bacterium]|nr:hypothetical protein [Planctomycetota bacterium]